MIKLELASYPIRDVRFDNRTQYDHGVLLLDKEELTRLALQDERVASANVDVAYPGEQTRIVNVADAVEPRVKVAGPGCVFPGILGPIETVGEGRTNRLSGLAVIHTVQYKPTVVSGTGAPNLGLLDMWGPVAALSPLSSTINVVLSTKLVDGVSELEAHKAIQLAECRVACRLAETTKDASIEPESVEVFELSAVDASLPRVVYVLGFYTEWHTPHSRAEYYGLPIRESLPTLVHPNELLDGAITTDARKGNGNYPLTWAFMNQPVVLALLREHGKRLNFVGLILQRTRFESEFGKQATAACTAQLARLVGADNALITRTISSGNNLIDVMLTVQACERKGIKTVLMTPEEGGNDGFGPALKFYVPEAVAMVSTGNYNLDPQLPAPTKVIGCDHGQMVALRPGEVPFSPWGEVQFERCAEIAEAVDWFGFGHATCSAH
ncbi:MAG: hypothetical protein HY675_26750 [Chloroflexi bacterium]|nr:hypothetical protein [Chloroflexota bacterium]